MSTEDFVSFDKALRDLQMRSEELRKLVSEGEIRAFRDGDSMKFRREDIDSLQLEDSLEDTLEDDTGMVTEELSDEDTLLVDDDLDDIAEEPASTSAPVVTASTTRGQRVRSGADSSVTPAWVTAAAIVGTAMSFYGLLVIYSVAKTDASGFATFLSWAPK